MVSIGASAAIVFGIIIVISFKFSIEAVFLLWAAETVGIKERSFGKAFVSMVLGQIIYLLSFIFILIFIDIGGIPIIGVIFAVIYSFLIQSAIVMNIFKTTFGKGFGATILLWILSCVVFGTIALFIALFIGLIVAASF